MNESTRGPQPAFLFKSLIRRRNPILGMLRVLERKDNCRELQLPVIDRPKGIPSTLTLSKVSQPEPCQPILLRTNSERAETAILIHLARLC